MIIREENAFKNEKLNFKLIYLYENNGLLVIISYESNFSIVIYIVHLKYKKYMTKNTFFHFYDDE